MEVKTHELRVGNWKTKATAHSLTLPKQAKEQAMEIIKNYVDCFPEEDVWVQNKFKVPSLLLSMNCIFRNDLHVYSISQNPKNLGIATILNQEFKAALGHATYTWPKFKTTIHPQFQDDYLWTESLNLTDALRQPRDKEDLILIRNPEFNLDHDNLHHRSISLINKRNVNSYGESLNLWKLIPYGNSNKLPWDKGFALKPISKTKSQFNIYRPMHGPGLISEERVEEIISNRNFYVQNFIAPLNSPIEGEKMIFKIFFAYDLFRKEYRYLSGLWLSRANYRIHGTPETTFGKLV